MTSTAIPPTATPSTATPSTDDQDRAVLCDDTLALRFSERLERCARYVIPWRRWMVFNGKRWRAEESLCLLGEARAVCREVARTAWDPRMQAQIRSAATAAALERLARSDLRHAASVDQWDRNPWLLNTPGGTVDLRTGELRPHRREDWITKRTGVTPGGECPLFLAFLERIFAGDAALIAFVQRALGYALSGTIAEHALFFCYGTGGNGKSVLLNTVAGILGDYAAVAPLEAFSAQGDRASADLAMLRGARFVMAQETERGRRWNEARLKTLTGGDAVTARTMRGDFFTYRPGFKLFVAGNNVPELSSVDEAIRRRFNLVPFGVTIADPDPALSRKLEAEWPGILAWMIDGALEWQRMGLAPPAAVTEATAAYLAEEDTFGAWLDACVGAAAEDVMATTADLFASWASFAATAQEPAGSKKAFARALQARGFAPCRIGRSGDRGFRGLCLHAPIGRREPENPSASVSAPAPEAVTASQRPN